MARPLRSLLVLAVMAVMALASACGSESEPLPSAETTAEAPPGSYFLGPEFEGMELTAVLQPPDGAGDSTSFIYGDCEASGDSGCAPPLEIQTWRLCARPPAPGRVRDLTPLRGALADIEPRFPQIELYAGMSTVVIFAEDHALALAAAERVRPAGSQRPPGGLTAPPAAALHGRGACSRDETVPSSIRDREPLPDCGRTEPASGAGERREVDACLRRAVAAGEPFEVTRRLHTGGRGQTEIVRFNGNDRDAFQIYVDEPRDGWKLLRCIGVDPLVEGDRGGGCDHEVRLVP